MATRKPLVVLLGATAVGKTATALSIGVELPVEVINGDSRAFYRGMDIGTAKPSPAERALVPHHLIDILDPDEPMSLATFQDLAYRAIDDIHARGHVPLLVGGTPQYINAVVEGWRIPRVPPDRHLRQELEREIAAHGVAPLLERLHQIDPTAAGAIGPNPRRIIRALEVFEATGRPISEQQGKSPVPFDTLEIELWMPRDQLYNRIDQRVERQVEQGLFAEVQALLDRGYTGEMPALSSIGYRQVIPYLTGSATAGEVIERIQVETHRLVRHQQTWFRKNDRLVRVDMTHSGAVKQVIELTRAFCGTWLARNPPVDR